MKALDSAALPAEEAALGRALAAELQRNGAVMGIFDEGCMGMYNAIFDDEYINPLGIFKERLSQSALYYRMTTVSDEEAEAVFKWLVDRGVTFDFGPDPDENLTKDQVLQQCKMYIAALRIADDFGCAGIGIQYQQGLKDLVPASDLAEGLLNEQDRPPAFAEDGRELYPGQPLPHFNEVDWGCGVDALITNRVWTAMGLNPSTSLHDVRWGDPWGDDFVWVMEISGSVPPSHLRGGYEGVTSQRQPAMYFRLGGGTIKGISKPGPVVYSRVFLMDDKLHVDMGIGEAVELPDEETQRRWDATTPVWPIMHLVMPGVTRDQFMARHKSNHIQVVYAPDMDSGQEGPGRQGCHVRRAGRGRQLDRQGRPLAAGRGHQDPGSQPLNRGPLRRRRGPLLSPRWSRRPDQDGTQRPFPAPIPLKGRRRRPRGDKSWRPTSSSEPARVIKVRSR